MTYFLVCCLSTLIAEVPKAGAPATFTGGIGSFRVACFVDRPSLHADQTLQLTLEIAGDGDVSAVVAPSLERWPGMLDQFQPVATPATKHTADGVTFIYTLRPNRTGELTIAPLRLTFYQPRHRRYETAATKSLQVQVEPSATIGPEGVIHPAGGSAASIPPVVWWLVVLLALPAAAVLVRLSRRRTSRREAPLQTTARSSAVREVPIPRQDRERAQDPVAAAYTKLRDAAAEQLGRDCRSLTSAELLQVFRDHGISGESLVEMQQTLQAVDRARFGNASEKSTSELAREVQELAERVRRRTGVGP